MGSSGSSKVKYTQSPEQRRITDAMMPMVEGLGQYGTQRYFGGEPNMGAPSMQGVRTGVPLYDVPGYDIPNPSIAMPTSQWFNALAPEVKTGLYAPYVEAGQGVLEHMGMHGQAGSARGGYSGAAGAAIGKLASEAAKNVGLNAWQMTAPAAQGAWQAGLQRNVNMWNQDVARNKLAYDAQVGERMGDYQTAMNVWGMPYQSMGLIGAGMPQAYANQPGMGVAGTLGSGLMGGLGGYAMASMIPALSGAALPIGLGMGALGLLGGK